MIIHKKFLGEIEIYFPFFLIIIDLSNFVNKKIFRIFVYEQEKNDCWSLTNQIVLT